MLITSNYNKMDKAVIHVPKLRVGQYLLSFVIRYYLNITLTFSKFFIQRRTLLCQKNKMLNTRKLNFNKEESNQDVQ